LVKFNPSFISGAEAGLSGPKSGSARGRCLPAGLCAVMGGNPAQNRKRHAEIAGNTSGMTCGPRARSGAGCRASNATAWREFKRLCRRPRWRCAVDGTQSGTAGCLHRNHAQEPVGICPRIYRNLAGGLAVNVPNCDHYAAGTQPCPRLNPHAEYNSPGQAVRKFAGGASWN